jgi:hypothetical protein
MLLLSRGVVSIFFYTCRQIDCPAPCTQQYWPEDGVNPPGWFTGEVKRVLPSGKYEALFSDGSLVVLSAKQVEQGATDAARAGFSQSKSRPQSPPSSVSDY